MSAFIAPGATLGVLGGGQLGRMFVHAAQQMGYATAVLDPDAASPAGLVAHEHIRTDYLDPIGLARLAEVAAAITTEFENVPAAALEQLARSRPVAPAAAAVATCQDRLAEKACFVASGLTCAPHTAVSDEAQLPAVDGSLLPGILKTARFGYDGKGQAVVETRQALEAAWTRLGRAPCVLEQRLDIAIELSVIVARSASGELVHFPVQQNLHRRGILAVTQVPAPDVAALLQDRAIADARRLADALGYVGVLCVEFFVLADGSLVVNEMAPRPHNSGHHTLDSCDLSQFDLQVRAMSGAPLVQPRQHSPCVMLNLLGELWFDRHGSVGALGVDGAVARSKAVEPDWSAVLGLPGAHLHLYGKATARPGRKMGHLSFTAATAAEADANARLAALRLGIAGW
jgi:5-(carboxyamino)imidazole ribonucleotide synthase